MSKIERYRTEEMKDDRNYIITNYGEPLWKLCEELFPDMLKYSQGFLSLFIQQVLPPIEGFSFGDAIRKNGKQYDFKRHIEYLDKRRTLKGKLYQEIAEKGNRLHEITDYDQLVKFSKRTGFKFGYQSDKSKSIELDGRAISVINPVFFLEDQEGNYVFVQIKWDKNFSLENLVVYNSKHDRIDDHDITKLTAEFREAYKVSSFNFSEKYDECAWGDDGRCYPVNMSSRQADFCPKNVVVSTQKPDSRSGDINSEIYFPYTIDLSGRFLLLDGFVVNLNQGKVWSHSYNQFEKFECDGKISREPEKKDGQETGNTILTVENEENPNKKITIIYNKLHQIISIRENWFDKLPDRFFRNMPYLEYFETNAIELGEECLEITPSLKKIVAPRLENCSQPYTFSTKRKLTHFYAPSLQNPEIIMELEAPSIEEIKVPKEIVDAVVASLSKQHGSAFATPIDEIPKDIQAQGQEKGFIPEDSNYDLLTTESKQYILDRESSEKAFGQDSTAVEAKLRALVAETTETRNQPKWVDQLIKKANELLGAGAGYISNSPYQQQNISPKGKK